MTPAAVLPRLGEVMARLSPPFGPRELPPPVPDDDPLDDIPPDYAEFLRLADGASCGAAGWTALIAACNAGNTEIARMLLDAGADPAARNDEGYTAFGRVPGDATKLVRLMAERDAALL